MLKLLALAALLAAAAAAPEDYPQIKDLKQCGSTLNSVTLCWTLDVSQFVPVLYTLHVNGILTLQFFNDGTFTYTVTGLQSCTHYTFDLTASYTDTETGPTADGFGMTNFETPGAVGGLTVDGSVISWTAPTNARCVEYYTVCYRSTVIETDVCQEGVVNTFFDMGLVSACDELDVTVAAVGGGISGETSAVHVITEKGEPGVPRDVEVVPLTESTVLLAWNPPLENPACALEFAITFGPVSNLTATEVSDENEVSKTEDKDDEDEEDGKGDGPSGQQFTAELDNILPCTDYRFGVASVAAGGFRSDEAVVYMATNESAPGLLPDIGFDHDQDSITITWGDVSEEACLDVIQICYIDPIDHTYQCVDVPSTPNTWTLNGLGACLEYEFRITGLSPDGLVGETTVITVPTLDRAPGPVQNLALDNIEMSSVTVTYDAPIDYPECAETYVVTYTNIMDVLDTRSAIMRAGSFITDIDGLDACATYDIGVSAVSPTKIEGPFTHVRTLLKQGEPGPPTSGSLVGSTETSLTVLWSAPTDTRFCVDTYEVRVSEAGSGPTQLVVVLDFNQNVMETFTGLNSCTTYMVQIRSRNTETTSSSPYAIVLNDAKTLC